MTAKNPSSNSTSGVSRGRHRVGLLGGGQLARMLALAAPPINMDVHILSAQAQDPAAQVSPHWRQGDPNQEKDLKSFVTGLDALSFESEFFDMSAVRKAVAENPGVFVYPRPELMAQIQDRRSQKALLDQYKIPTSSWQPISSFADLTKAENILDFPFVLKKAQGGYDGYGTFHIGDPDEFDALKKISPFPAIVEKSIHFKRELAVIMFRSRDGEVLVYPLVESRQKDSRCDLVLGPLKHAGLDALLKKFRRLLSDTDYVGALGIEMFDTGRELLVNELAPRVHNTGHYSQNALNWDQFQLHLLCGRHGALPKIELHGKAFVMANLISQDATPLDPAGAWTGSLHWYGKTESRPGRKMGHVNYCGANAKELLRCAQRERAQFLKRSSS